MNYQYKNLFIVLAGLLIVGLIGLTWFFFNEEPSQSEKILEERQTTQSLEKKEETEKKINTEVIDPEKIEQGCPEKDCIPSIDEPKFEAVENAGDWLEDEDLIFGVEIQGIVRGYPQKILNWHEIVNDSIKGEPIAVTFCPLCGSAFAFRRIVNSQEVDFGVSGKLYNSNLIMYDRTEENYWQQETGLAIVGPAVERDEKLETVPMISLNWNDWKELYPDSEILSKETGYTRDYDQYPYNTYEEDGRLLFGVENEDDRLPLKEPGYGFTVDENYKFYTEEVLKEMDTIEDTIGSTEVTVEYNNGKVLAVNQETQEEIVPVRTFWFAFAAFHPGVEVYSD